MVNSAGASGAFGDSSERSSSGHAEVPRKHHSRTLDEYFSDRAGTCAVRAIGGTFLLVQIDTVSIEAGEIDGMFVNECQRGRRKERNCIRSWQTGIVAKRHLAVGDML